MIILFDINLTYKRNSMKNVAIIMGGYSSEYQISLTSGSVVYHYLDKTKYSPYQIHIARDKWVYVNELKEEFPINKNDFSVDVNGKKVTFDVVFNAIHGSPGEDGLMQAYFELVGIPQTSCDYYQSALTFNKRDLLSVLKPYGIKTATSFYLNLGDEIDLDKLANDSIVIDEKRVKGIISLAIVLDKESINQVIIGDGIVFER